jgi:hypothetical protein
MSGIRFFLTGDDIHQRGFAAAVWTDQRGAFTLIKTECNFFENGIKPVRFRKVLNSKHNNLPS